MTESFDELLNFDPLHEAEKTTGLSYKEDEATQLLGALMAMDHSDEKREELALRNDSYYNISFDAYLAILENLDFKLVFAEGLGENDEFHIYWRDGILLSCDSYGDKLNSAKAYFNAEFSNGSAPWAQRLSGHLDDASYKEGKYVWVGDFDAREGLRHRLACLEDASTILSSWVARPFLFLLNHMESRSLDSMSDSSAYYEVINSIKIDRFPASIQRAIQGSSS